MENNFRKLATHLTREEKLKYISEKMSEEQRNTYTLYIPSKENIYIKNGKQYIINSDFVAKPNSFLVEIEMPEWQLLNETKEMGNRA